MVLEVIITLLAVLLFFLYKRWSRIYNHWNERRLPHRKPYPFFGNVFQIVFKKKSLGEIILDIGNEFNKEPLIGFYNFTKPTLLINDPYYAETILIKEFSSFINRREPIGLQEMRPLDKQLFFISDAAWKALRHKMLPIFSGNKLRVMIPKMDELFDNVSHRIDTNIDNPIKVKDLVELYTLSVRATCVYGYDIRIESKEFMKRFIDLSNLSLYRFIESMISMFFPKISSKLDLSFFGSEKENFLAVSFLKALKKRSEEGIVKQDLLDAILELKKKGKVELNHWTKEDDCLDKNEKYRTTETVDFDDDILVAQGVVFLLAGFDPIVLINILTLFELAQNKLALEKLRTEVDNVIDRHNGFSYQALNEMQYLEMCIKESLRLYPVVDVLTRTCNKSFTFDKGFTVEKGTELYVPVYKFHLDPKYFPEPKLYKPERFEHLDLPTCVYLPFGDGPRECIGIKFSMFEMKMFLSKIIYNYDFDLDNKTELPVSFDHWFFLKRVITPINLYFTKRTH